MKKIYIALLAISLFSCKKQEKLYPTPCDGNCGTNYNVVYENQSIYPNPNGYYEIQWNSLEYFQIKGQLTPVRERYIINKIPLVEAKFDSDYWVVFDTLLFQTPMYSYLGWFNDNTLNTPIPFGNFTYTLNDLIGLHPPTNIVGYQIPKYFCIECPYAPTLVGTYSKYTYNPTQNILLDNEMVGDTINIFIETIFNTDVGESELVPDNLKIIII